MSDRDGKKRKRKALRANPMRIHHNIINDKGLLKNVDASSCHVTLFLSGGPNEETDMHRKKLRSGNTPTLEELSSITIAITAALAYFVLAYILATHGDAAFWKRFLSDGWSQWFLMLGCATLFTVTTVTITGRLVALSFYTLNQVPQRGRALRFIISGEDD